MKNKKKRRKRSLIAKLSIGLACGSAGVVSAGLIGFLIYNYALSNKYKHILPPGSPHGNTEDVYDPNGNNFDIDAGGSIVTDTMTDEEIEALKTSLTNLLLTDAAKFTNEVKNLTIIDFALMPCNLNEAQNEYDKFMFSVLFANEKNETFALNYVAGKNFETDAEISKDYFADFINYVEFECGLDNCVKMSAAGQKVKAILKDAAFVGNAFLGFNEMGEECYFIPVFYGNGQGSVYSCLCSVMDAYYKNPLEELANWLTSSGDGEINFSVLNFNESDSIKEAMQILLSKLTLTF